MVSSPKAAPETNDPWRLEAQPRNPGALLPLLGKWLGNAAPAEVVDCGLLRASLLEPPLYKLSSEKTKTLRLWNWEDRLS